MSSTCFLSVRSSPAFVLSMRTTPGCTMLEFMQQRLTESSHAAWVAGCPVRRQQAPCAPPAEFACSCTHRSRHQAWALGVHVHFESV